MSPGSMAPVVTCNAGIEERKKRRRISNRDSARKSRMKKQQQMDTFQSEITKMESQVKVFKEQIDVVAGNYFEIESENKVLKAQYDELSERLEYLNSFLKMMGFVNGYEFDIPEMPQALLEPWQQLPCPTVATTTTGGMFKC